MKQYWQSLSDKFDAMSTREKWLITLCGFVAVVMLMVTLVIEPVLGKVSVAQRQLASTQSSNQVLQGELLQLTARLRQDPNKEIDIEYKRLLKDSQKLSQQLSGVVDQLVTPSQMSLLLETVLQQSQELNLVSLSSMGAERLNSGQGDSSYYVHPVRIELTGGYFDVLTYLEALETLPVKYYWRKFHYQVEDYPQARLIMEVYTLGARKEFIGG
ncbi:type II secretion system protein GspM [Vibrio agarivorans]|uniref:Type II secretion system protein GspM n=1 Tax=Vibrio agarivorans TaxID=153622 RepID=A0ABT7XWH9_9VIBR|nr:type II secretion system protein GspM [Vibrio agarivorans]MDN2480138.1 type II secretion system protein GspM [Vibrio agarivorans]